MSTKTTIKRIALVAVSALGFGMLTTVNASAATVSAGPTASFSTNTSSITLIDPTATSSSTYAVFEVSLTNSDGIAAPLQSGETLTATVTSSPQPNKASGATAVGDLTLEWATTFATSTALVSGVMAYNASSYPASDSSNSLGGAFVNLSDATALRGGTDTSADYTTSTSGSTATYALKVSSNSANSINAGFYTIRIQIVDSNGNSTVSSKTVKFGIASSASNSGAVLTTTVTGSQTTGTLAGTTLQNIRATLKDANGGLIRSGANAAPTVTMSVKDAGSSATPPVYYTSSLTLGDAGTTASDSDASTVLDGILKDGVYEASGTINTSSASGTATVTASYGDALATASLTITGDTSGNYMNTSVSATGKVQSNGTTISSASTAKDFVLPLTTKSASVTAQVLDNADATSTSAAAVASAVVYYTVTYSGCVLGDMTPATVSAMKKATADANGQVKVEITNANPVDGCAVTVTFTGATVNTTVASTTTASLARTLTWSKPSPTSVVVSPAGDYKAKTASTNKVTWTVLDQFSTPVVGSTVQFTLTGANKPATGTSLASAITDANGQVSVSWTDAAAVDADTDTIKIASVGTVSSSTVTGIAGSRTVTYKTTMPTVASLYATYTATNASGTTLTGLIPTTAIGGTTGILTSTADQIDSAKTQTGGTTGAWVKVNFTAKDSSSVAVSGVPTTVTVTGAQLIGSSGLLATSTIAYANDNLYVLGTKAGTATVTATNGSITSTATINFVNAYTDARVISLSKSGAIATATVVDAFGSPVKGASVDVVGSGGAWLGNGATTASYSTAADGTVSFAVTGAGTVTASLSKTTYTKTAYLAGAGNATGTVVTTGAPAGVSSASVDVSGLGTSDATDAANEATDAANAATDAANAAAEAADAATAAAQDAQAAVAALASQVADLVAGLKAQITALTNLVIKIQKKVKA